MGEQQTHPEGNEKVGFFERRWRMVKAAAKQAYDYLFDVKTYVAAAAMFGAVALINNPTLSSFFGMNGATSATDVGIRALKFIGMSTLFRTGIAMAKESYACNNCPTSPAPTPCGGAIEKAENVLHALEPNAALDYFTPTFTPTAQYTPPTKPPAQPGVSTPPR